MSFTNEDVEKELNELYINSNIMKPPELVTQPPEPLGSQTSNSTSGLSYALIGLSVYILIVIYMGLSSQPEFNTQYEVTFLNVAGQEVTRVYYLPNGINSIDVIGDQGTYSMYVFYEDHRRKELLKTAVIDVLKYKKLTNVNH